MEDLHAKLERLSLEAEDCELIAKLATDLKKRAMFAKLAFQFRAMARDIEALIMDVRRTCADGCIGVARWTSRWPTSPIALRLRKQSAVAVNLTSAWGQNAKNST